MSGMIGRGHRLALATCLVGAAFGCGVPPAPEPPHPVRDWRALVGCYQAGNWSFALDSVPALTNRRAPPNGARQAWNYSRRPRGDIYWTLLPDGHAEVVEDAGLDGGTARFLVSADSLVGTRTAWDDFTPRRPPEPIVARKTRCPGPPAHDGPPPHPEQLQGSFVRGLADMLQDSVMRRFWMPVLPGRSGTPPFTAAVNSMLRRDSRETTHGIWFDVEPSVTRNEAVALVSISVCKDRPEPMNLHVERVRYRFVRAPGRWQLVSSEPLGTTEGECGSHLPASPRP